MSRTVISLDLESTNGSHVLSSSLMSTPRAICVLSSVASMVKVWEFDQDWKVAILYVLLCRITTDVFCSDFSFMSASKITFEGQVSQLSSALVDF